MKSITITLLSIFFCLNNETKQNLINKNFLEKTCKTWNEKTINSVNDQLLKTTNPHIKSAFQNHLDVLQISLYSLTANKKGVINKGKSARYKFLQTVFANNKVGKNMFIIEEQIENEVVQSRNYLIENDISTSHVIVYNYFKNDWTEVRDTIISKVNLHSELSLNRRLDKLSGNNSSAVILSEFDSSSILSHYYIPLSIEDSSLVSKILEL